jgi:ubiquinone/menaquinone biosynthesis C-methylase UbiE
MDGAQLSSLKEVHNFWNTEACGTHFVAAPAGTPEFYVAYRRFRYNVEFHIPELIQWAGVAGKNVLEIGVGNGADGVLIAQSGATYTGVDITEAALKASAAHFDCLGIKGRFQLENAENLSFPDSVFEVVYSYGVLHHSPHPEKAIKEVHRVLKPGGTALIMLYHKHSFNYYVRIMGYMRARCMMKIAARMGKWSSDRKTMNARFGIRGNQDHRIWQVHYENFLSQGFSYLSAGKFIHHATDGPDCPYAYVFTKRDVHRIFSAIGFSQIETRVVHFPMRKYSTLFPIPLSIERMLASLFGWYLVVRAVK